MLHPWVNEDEVAGQPGLKLGFRIILLIEQSQHSLLIGAL